MTARELHSRVSETDQGEVMSLRLVPFTIGHAKLLDHLECDALESVADVALSAIICSRPQHEALRFVRSWWFKFWVRIWNRACKGWDPYIERDKLLEYLKRNTELPAIVSRTEASSSTSPIPHHQALRVILISKLNYRPSQVDATPYLQALWDVASLAYSSGRVDVLDMSQSDLMDLPKRFGLHPITE